ncbi:helix-turn-helix transcriptional regulator [Herbiconiux moechotypicola]|uniref:Helix-turn-helix transcriptional regulator n=2 Tax=Herbiconiux moechotypicola TaxID=637393 RepID=A0ABN3E235_9MICO
MRPEDVNLVAIGQRRVAGLRRDEVARLAGISQEYYIRLEQGRDHQPSDQVLRALARALRLGSDGVEYMHRLVRIQSGGVRLQDSEELAAAVDEGLRSMLAQWPSTPAMIVDRNLGIRMSNESARSELPGRWEPGSNAALVVFGDDWKRCDLQWERSARTTAAALRYSSDPGDPELHDLVGVLSLRDATFRGLWGNHLAAPPVVTEVDLVTSDGEESSFTQQAFQVPGDRGLVLIVLHRGQLGQAARSA